MSRQIKVGGSNTKVALPNGRVLTSGQSVVLSDADWALIAASPLVGTTILDQGDSAAAPDLGPGVKVVSLGGTGGTDPETVRDTIGAALVAGNNVVVSVNDALDTITISTVGARVLTLTGGAPVPPGTPAGTLIVRY